MKKNFQINATVDCDRISDKVLGDVTGDRAVSSMRVIIYITGAAGTGKTFLAKLLKDLIVDKLGDADAKGIVEDIHIDQMAKNDGDAWTFDSTELRSHFEGLRATVPTIHIVEGSLFLDATTKLLTALKRPDDVYYYLVTDPDPLIFTNSCKRKAEEKENKDLSDLDQKLISMWGRFGKMTPAKATTFLKKERNFYFGMSSFDPKGFYLVQNVLGGNITEGWHENHK